MTNKFEKLVEYIVNEDEEKAQELFHEIVVEKSRAIYNDIVNEEGDETDDFVSDIEADEEGDEMDMSDDEGDFGDDDMGGDDFGDDEMDDEELEDRVVDLETALDELKAEFDQIMAGDDDMDMDMDMGGDDEFGGDEMDMDMDMDMDDTEEPMEEFTFEDEEEVEESDDEDEDDEDEDVVREYVEKAPAAKHEDHKATSPVAGPNKMGGGTTANIVKGGTNPNPDGTTPNKGSGAKPQDMNTGNRNVPGGKAGKPEKAPAAKMGPKDNAQQILKPAKKGS